MTWIDYRKNVPSQFERQSISPLPPKCIVAITNYEHEVILEKALKLTYNPYERKEQELFIRECKVIADSISTETKEKILLELDHGFGTVLVTNLPIDKNLPQTPLKGGSLEPNFKNTFISEAVLIALGFLTNAEPFNFRQEGFGSSPLIDNIVPVPELRFQKGAGGFENNFPFHCESAWHRKRPDYLILNGIREDPSAITLVFSTEQILQTQFAKSYESVLGKFRLRSPDLYIQMENLGIPLGTPEYTFLSPIEKIKDEFIFNINFNGTDCLDHDSLNWLKCLELYIEQNALGTLIGANSALILNNSKTCHTRTGYTPIFNGYDRWFLRGYFKKDLWEVDKINLGNTENKWANTDIEELIKMGWLSNDMMLTPNFAEYIYSPEKIKELSQRKQDLVSIACNFTPIANTRIV